MYKFCITVLLVTFILRAGAQTSLPGFSVDSLGKNLTRISWFNPYGTGLIQLNVQSSSDSVKNFRTFFTSPSPQLPQNGIVDKRPFYGKLYYRIFYVTTGGAYFFTPPKIAGVAMPGAQSDVPQSYTAVNQGNGYMASMYVMVNQDGFAEIKLPDAAGKKYKLIFYDADHNLLFTINKITDTDLVLDKTNFLHAGTFYFELYNGDKLVEKNSIYLRKEF